jgi:hypothetical protein
MIISLISSCLLPNSWINYTAKEKYETFNSVPAPGAG